MNILDIPGYREALIAERFVRDSAFLGLTENVAGFELKPMTLRHKMILQIARSPLLDIEGDVAPGQLAQFLWLLSAEYSQSERARKQFLKRCRKFVPPAPQRWGIETRRWRNRFNRGMIEKGEALRAARAFVAESIMDRPPQASRVGFSPDYYSEIVFWLSLFEYRLTAEQVLDMPLKCLYQIFNERREHASPEKSALCNPSDMVRRDWMIAVQNNSKKAQTN